jgi:hypothetical protein
MLVTNYKQASRNAIENAFHFDFWNALEAKLNKNEIVRGE